MRKPLYVLSAVIVAVGLSATSPAVAQHSRQQAPSVDVLRARLQPVPHDPAADRGSDVSGQAVLVVRGNTVRTVLVARGLSPNLPHAMHIHGELEAVNECPSLAADKDGNGLIDTVEGLPDYGPIQVSLTTSGGTSGDFSDALALDRFPTANRGGTLTYHRVIDVPTDVATSLDKLHIVVHGADLNGNGQYDFDAGRSSLSDLAGAEVPVEAELPVACGTIG